MTRCLSRFRTWCIGIAALIMGLILAPLALAPPAAAQSYPSHLVKIIVPFTAGSVTDIMARILANELSEKWGQNVIVENRPGISGTLAVAQSKPDGYTLMLTSNGHTVASLVNKDLPFDPVKDFIGITRVCTAPYVMIVNPDVKATSLKELIALAKTEPGKLNFSSPGLASSTFIGGALFRKAAGIDVMHVPYKGAPESVLAVLRGEVQFYFAPINLAKELADGGKVRALAVATPQRNPSMPNVPTFAEAGLPFTYDGWFGLMAPKGVPAAIIAKINADVVGLLHTPKVQDKLAQQFVIPVTDTPAAFEKTIREETANLTQVFKEAGIGGN